MRLLMLPPSWDAGGAERVALGIAGNRAARGDEVVLAAPPGSLDPTPLPPGVRRVVLGAGGRGPLAAARGTASVARVARRERPDLLHAHNPRATAAAWLSRATVMPRPRVVATYHGVPEADRRTAARILSRADEVVCVSSDLRRELESAGFARGRARVVPNGVEEAPPVAPERASALRAELGLEGHLVTLVGRLVEQKAPERFLEAARLVLAARADTTFLVVGDGPLRQRLERQAAAVGARVRIAGLRDDARELIAISDLLVFTSVWEGLSIAALEALAAGVPVVAGDVSGMAELLGSGAGQIVAEPRPESFARAIESLLDDPSARETMGEAGRALVRERYSVDVMGAGYDEVYARALKGAG